MSEPEIVGTALTPVAFGKHFRWTASGLDVISSPTYEVAAAFGEQMRTVEVSLPFAVGDYLNYIVDRWPELSDQIISECGWSAETVRNYRWIARSVPRPNRMLQAGLS